VPPSAWTGAHVRQGDVVALGGSDGPVVALGGFGVALGAVVRPGLREVGTTGAWLVAGTAPGLFVAVGGGSVEDGDGGGVVATVDSSGAAGWTGAGSVPR